MRNVPAVDTHAALVSDSRNRDPLAAAFAHHRAIASVHASSSSFTPSQSIPYRLRSISPFLVRLISVPLLFIVLRLRHD